MVQEKSVLSAHRIVLRPNMMERRVDRIFELPTRRQSRKHRDGGENFNAE